MISLKISQNEQKIVSVWVADKILASEGSGELIFFGFSDQINFKAHLSFLIYQK